jgi:hypothetical protein
MTPVQLQARLLLALALSGCTVQVVDAQDPGAPLQAPVESERPLPAGAAVLPAPPAAVDALQVDLKDGPYTLGDVTAVVRGLPSETVYLLASTGLGRGQVLGHRTGLLQPVVVGVVQGEGVVRAAHGLQVMAGERVYLQAISADRQGAVMETVTAAFIGTCADVSFQELEERTIVCDSLAIPGQCAGVEQQPDLLPSVIREMGPVPLGTTVEAVCHESNATGSCCYEVAIVQPAGDSGIVWDTGWGWEAGRPFRVAGETRQTQVTGEAEVADPVVAEVVAAWTQMAREEHASVAAFARFTLEMLQLGAPMELVALCSQAQAEEVRHTQLTLSVASQLSGATLELGELDMGGALDGRDLRTVTLDVVREGCINETVSALLAMEGRDRAVDPRAVEALSIIADDEARHSELAWKFVRWALVQDPSLRDEVVSILRSFQPDVTAEPRIDADALAAFGVLDEAATQAVAQRAARVVAACTAALC